MDEQGRDIAPDFQEKPSPGLAIDEAKKKELIMIGRVLEASIDPKDLF